jgi:hypothetical protein
MAAGSSMQAAPLQAVGTQAGPAQASASLTAISRRSRPLPAPFHPAHPAAYANFALHTMHAHRLWIRLWITLGQPEENSNGPEGNAGVTPWGMPQAHSHPGPSTTGSHSRCAHSRRRLAGRIDVIPGIHRSYDDYQFSNKKQIHIKIGKRPAAAPCASASPRRPGCSGAPVTRACDQIPDQIRRATGEDRP